MSQKQTQLFVRIQSSIHLAIVWLLNILAGRKKKKTHQNKNLLKALATNHNELQSMQTKTQMNIKNEKKKKNRYKMNKIGRHTYEMEVTRLVMIIVTLN